jgi:hypothetical protein
LAWQQLDVDVAVREPRSLVDPVPVPAGTRYRGNRGLNRGAQHVPRRITPYYFALVWCLVLIGLQGDLQRERGQMNI